MFILSLIIMLAPVSISMRTLLTKRFGDQSNRRHSRPRVEEEFKAYPEFLSDNGMCKKEVRITDLNELSRETIEDIELNNFDKVGFAYVSFTHRTKFMDLLREIREEARKGTLEFFTMVMIKADEISDHVGRFINEWKGIAEDSPVRHWNPFNIYARSALSSSCIITRDTANESDPNPKVHIDFKEWYREESLRCGEFYTVWIPLLDEENHANNKSAEILSRNHDPLIFMDKRTMMTNPVDAPGCEEHPTLLLIPYDEHERFRFYWKSNLKFGMCSIHDAFESPHFAAPPRGKEMRMRRKSIEVRIGSDCY